MIAVLLVAVFFIIVVKVGVGGSSKRQINELRELQRIALMTDDEKLQLKTKLADAAKPRDPVWIIIGIVVVALAVFAFKMGS